jgi:hypothetical protein
LHSVARSAKRSKSASHDTGDCPLCRAAGVLLRDCPLCRGAAGSADDLINVCSAFELLLMRVKFPFICPYRPRVENNFRRWCVRNRSQIPLCAAIRCARGFASLRLGCAMQNFDSVATQPSLRMTLGGPDSWERWREIFCEMLYEKRRLPWW